MRICTDGLPFILPLAVGAVVLLVVGQPLGTAIITAVALVVAAFFRDPDRVAEAPPGAVVSPADGVVLAVHGTDSGSIFVAIFLSLFDVHVTRAPAAGELRRCVRRPGGFAPAQLDAASGNARVEMDLQTAAGPLRLSLMAGLVARRVLPWVRAPMALRRGQRIAIIRFGSRAEMTLPPGFVAAVDKGSRVRAGETVIANLATQGGNRG